MAWGCCVSAEPASKTRVGAFSRTGEYWTIGLGTSRFPIKDIKGLGYIQRLLKHPGQEFHALDLLSSAGAGTITADIVVGPEEALPVGLAIRRSLSGDAGEMLDAQAKREYQRRLHELNESLEDQRERGNHERADQIESEIEFLTRTIVRARGIGGRQRRTGSNAERARLSVTSAIKTALEKISDQDGELGTFLDRFIRTGAFCRYVPAPETPVIWEFSGESARAAPEIQKDGPSRPDRGRSFLRAFTAGTAFAGRNAERAMLTRALDQAEGGSGKIVLIGGGAGVGKTRLAAEIADDATRRGMLTVVGGCYDREEPVPLVPFVEILEAALAQTQNLAAFRETLGSDASEIARLLPQLRRAFPDISAPAELPPEQSRQMLFTAVTELVTRVAHSTPCLFLLDDLQWADKDSLLLLSHLVKFIPTMAVMVVGTFRDFDLDPAGPLHRTLDELIRGHLLERIALTGLPQESVGEMLRSLGGREPPEQVVRLFHAHTEGNPFFVEELFRHLVERGRLIDSKGEFRDDLKLDEIDVPQSLRVAIGRRLGRLDDDTLKALAVAAVIGRSFTFDLLAASLELDADATLNCLEEAEDAGLVTSRLDYPEARFQFSHELIRRAVLSDLSAPRRQRLHLRVADAIQRVYPNMLEDHVDDLVHHMWEAGTAAQISKTIEYLRMAYERALLKGAYETSLRHLRNALELLKTIPPSASRESQELALQTALGGTLATTKGYAAADVNTAYQRARTLSQVGGDSSKRVSVLLGLWSSSFVGGKHRAARELAEEALEVAQNRDDSIALLQAHQMVGISCFYQGELQRARTHLEQCRELPDPGRYRPHGDDPRVVSRSWLGVTLLRLGYPDQGLKTAQDALSLARQLPLPRFRNEAFAMNYVATLHMERHEWQEARDFAQQMEEISSAHGLTQWLIASNILIGVTLAEQGKVEEGAASLGRALAKWKETGASTSMPVFMGKLGTFYCRLGKTDEGLRILDDALTLSLETGEFLDSAELHRRRGEIVFTQLPGDNAGEETERCLLEAIRIARFQEGRYYELRAAIDLGHLWKKQGRSRQAHEILAPIYDWYTEGFGTQDLKQARALIAELL